MIDAKIKRLCEEYNPRFAIVNSAVSASSIKPIRQSGVAVITLIHEFSAYIRPIEVIERIAKWSNTMIFSSEMTRDDILKNCPNVINSKIEILPQGKCVNSFLRDSQLTKAKSKKRNDGEQLLKKLDANTIFIMGAGVVQPRKGVDLFVAAAARIKQKLVDKKIIFAWIGAGYDPVNDFNVSIWVNDQIQKYELADDLLIMDHTPCYGELMKRADFFLMTSRLDPLPNVSIDAMDTSTPMLCFDKGCGMASLMSGDAILRKYLVASYLDVNEMADKVVQMASDREKYMQVAQRCKTMAGKWFDMDKYIGELKRHGISAMDENEKLKQNSFYLLQSEDYDRKTFCRYQGLKKFSDDGVKDYLISWQNEVWPKKPEPGFHPGIYRDEMLKNRTREDPFTDYLKKGRPDGKWKIKLLELNDGIQINNTSCKVALHIHVYYAELFEEIVEALEYNQINPDIFISCSNERTAETVEKYRQKYGLNIKQIRLVPNFGRDIGPLITEFGKKLDQEYDIYGHIHTKKSEWIQQNKAYKWRQYLLGNLLGYKGYPMADKIVHAMNTHKKLGLVFPDDPTCVGWTNNYTEANKLASRLNIKSLPRSINFPVGTMFWAKKGALKNLYNLDLDWDDYPVEPIGYDGTMLHAIERLIPIVAMENGFKCNVTSLETLRR